MAAIWRHVSRCFIAGLVALLPIAGLVLAIVYLEYTIARAWLSEQEYYVPGLGILSTLVVIYIIGLIVSTFLGQMLWRQAERLLKRLPILGQLYVTLKQILGYGEGPGALFERVVLVPGRESNSWEIGLVTGQLPRDSSQMIVFVPASPNPLNGRLIVIAAAMTKPLAMSVNDAMRALVAVGKTGIDKIHVAG